MESSLEKHADRRVAIAVAIITASGVVLAAIVANLTGYLHFGSDKDPSLRFPVEVIDSVTKAPIVGAGIGWNIPDLSSEITDSQGRHTFQLTKQVLGKSATLTISKNGYVPRMEQIPSLQPQDGFHTVSLEQVAAVSKNNVDGPANLPVQKEQQVPIQNSGKPPLSEKKVDKQPNPVETKAPPVVVVGEARPDVLVGTYFEHSFKVEGGTPPFTWFVNPTMSDVKFDPKTATLSGTLMNAGRLVASVQVQDTNGIFSKAETFTMDVKPKPPIGSVPPPTQEGGPKPVNPKPVEPQPKASPIGVSFEDARVPDDPKLLFDNLTQPDSCLPASGFEKMVNPPYAFTLRCVNPGTAQPCSGGAAFTIMIVKSQTGAIVGGQPINVPTGGFKSDPAKEQTAAKTVCAQLEQAARASGLMK